jgi:hypothetical protein
MLLKLPTELIERVVRLSIPIETTSTTYADRQTLLRNLCLVNSPLRDIAQPVLREAVLTCSYTTWSIVRQRSKRERWAERVRYIFPSSQCEDDPEEEESEEVVDDADACRAPQTLVHGSDQSQEREDCGNDEAGDAQDEEDEGWPDLAVLQQFTALRKLSLHDVYEIELEKLQSLPCTFCRSPQRSCV